MKYLFPLLVFLGSFLSCYGQKSKEISIEKFLNEYSFPLSWTRVIFSENDTIIPSFCNAANPNVRIFSEDGQYQMDIIFGQEFEKYLIESVEITDTITFKFNLENRSPLSFSITFLDESFNLGHWYYKQDDPNDYQFLPSILISHIEPEPLDCN